ncbi:MAG: reverse transcriptase/maturase family protein [Candidatus Spechtbacterales bacterium]
MNLYSQIYDFQNLHSAYLNARKGKRYKGQILNYSYNIEENLLNLQKELKNKTYKHGAYTEFTIHDSKKRQIKAAPFKDRIVHHALYSQIEPIFDKSFIYDSYACRKTKGTHKALKRLETFLRSISTSNPAGVPDKDIYCLKCDISKYFKNVDHKTLFNLLKKKISCKDTLWLLNEIIQSNHESPGKGMPIGNLTSQLFANVYLNELDQFVKHTLREKYYIRYMDDFLIPHKDKKHLHETKDKIQEFLSKNLELEFNPKKADVFPLKNGIDFLGYRIYGTHRLLRKSTVKRFVKRTRAYKKQMGNGKMPEERYIASIQSWNAYAEKGNSWRLREKLESELGIKLIKM